MSNDSTTDTAIIDFWALDGSSLVDSAILTNDPTIYSEPGWSSAGCCGWYVSNAAPGAPPSLPTPEPTALLLLGMMGTLVVAVPKLLRRKDG